MKSWVRLLVWALCLASIACGAPLAESGTPAIPSSADNTASLRDALAVSIVLREMAIANIR
jgi:hypothetical protein